MKVFRVAAPALIALAAPVAVCAQEAPTNVEADDDAMLGEMLAGMFGAIEIEPLAAEEEARLPSAERVALAMLPPGFYGAMMDRMLENMLEPMFADAVTPELILASRTGASAEAIEALSEAEAEELARLVDPAYDQRMDAILNALGTVMRDVGQTVEGPMREGYARAFAKRFDRAQLTEIELFFSTSTGEVFASEFMALFSDPQVMSSMMQTMPTMFRQMGDMQAMMTEALGSLPGERSYADLDANERARLTAGLGLTMSELETALTYDRVVTRIIEAR